MVLMLLKNEALVHGVVGEIMTRFEKRGFTVKRARTIETDLDYWKQHYAVWKDKDFYDGLVHDMAKTPLILAIDWSHPINCPADTAINIARKMLGSSNPNTCDVSTIRGTYASSVRINFCHISDSLSSYQYEVNLAFPPSHSLPCPPSSFPFPSPSPSPSSPPASSSTTPSQVSPSSMVVVGDNPNSKFSTFIDFRKDKNTCNVCRSNLANDRIVKCTKGHDFHKRCLGDVEGLCPLCGGGLSLPIVN